MSEHEQKHTPGEWAVYDGQWGDHGDDEGGGFQIIMGPYDGGSIHTHRLINYAEGIFPEDKAYQEAQANARLIAAAPEILEANIAAFYEIAGLSLAHDVEQNGWRWPDHAPQHVHPVAEKLRAAIAKAEGK